MRRLRVFASFALTMTLAGAANGQQPAAQPSRIDPIRRSLARQIAEDRGHFDVQSVDYFALLWHPADSGSLLQVLQQYEDERADKQVGATSSAPGTTTLVSKGTVPKILGLAVENGAIARSQSGTTVTFRGNFGGAVRAVSKKGFFGWTPMGLTPDTDPAVRVLSRASGSVSFDTSRGSGNASNTFVGDQQQLSQWTLRAQIVNQRDPQGRAALDGWKQRVLQTQGRLSIATLELTTTLDMDPALKNWITRVDAEVQKAMPMPAGSRSVDEIAIDIEKALKEGEATFPESTLQNATALALSAYAASATEFIKNRHDLLESIAAGALVSLEYTSDRPLKAPTTSNIRLVWEVGGSVDLTGNAALTFFEKTPVGVNGRVRDVQASGEIDIKFGSADTVGAYVLALSAKYLHQLENSFSDLGIMIPDTKGTTAIGQVKLIIPVKGSGAKVPLSMTLANRTDLIKESIVRANVGLTFDLDSVFAKFKP